MGGSSQKSMNNFRLFKLSKVHGRVSSILIPFTWKKKRKENNIRTLKLE